jgi:hypothetical protein
MRLDNPIAQNLLVKQLERYQLKVTATSNGEEAVAGKLLVPNSILDISSTSQSSLGTARSWLFQRGPV